MRPLATAALMIGLGLGLGPVLRLGTNGLLAPYHVAIYGDSFGQRGQDITGAPNVIDAGNVDPQLLKWANCGNNTGS